MSFRRRKIAMAMPSYKTCYYGVSGADAVVVNNAAHPGSLSCQVALAAAVERSVPRIAYLFHNNSPLPMPV